jgi:hypothetical protein
MDSEQAGPAGWLINTKTVIYLSFQIVEQIVVVFFKY